MSQTDIKPMERTKQIFGSFYLAEGEFALAVSFVQEVVNAPPTYTALPLAPKYLRGLLNLRGTVVPVIDLRDLLNIQGGVSSENQKIAIIELSGSCIGLLFDKTGEVFRGNEEERSDFDSSQSSSVVSGVFKKDSGKRIVQILDVSKLFKLQNIPKDVNSSRLERESLGKKRGYRKQCISFFVGPAKCALPISDIQEILKINKVNQTVLSFGPCLGTIDLRGVTVPVIDFPALLNYREVDRTKAAIQGDRRIIVMKLGNEFLGFMVDRVDSIISYFEDELVSFPLVEQSRSEMFLGCITGHGETDILLLDQQKILSRSEISEITRGHSQLFQTKAKEGQSSGGGPRKTFITFKINCSYAIAINDVKEIIDYPKQLLQPPGLQKHVRGVLNLRGDLVTILDARSMYSAKQSEEVKEFQKVLVFNKNGAHFGLVVDSVESIVTFAEKDKVKLPEILYKQSKDSMTADIIEAVEVIDSSGTKRNLLILSADSLMARALKSLAA